MPAGGLVASKKAGCGWWGSSPFALMDYPPLVYFSPIEVGRGNKKEKGNLCPHLLAWLEGAGKVLNVTEKPMQNWPMPTPLKELQSLNAIFMGYIVYVIISVFNQFIKIISPFYV